jgi:hypothetical protein
MFAVELIPLNHLKAISLNLFSGYLFRAAMWIFHNLRVSYAYKTFDYRIILGIFFKKFA